MPSPQRTHGCWIDISDRHAKRWGPPVWCTQSDSLLPSWLMLHHRASRGRQRSTQLCRLGRSEQSFECDDAGAPDQSRTAELQPGASPSRWRVITGALRYGPARPGHRPAPPPVRPRWQRSRHMGPARRGTNCDTHADDVHVCSSRRWLDPHHEVTAADPPCRLPLPVTTSSPIRQSMSSTLSAATSPARNPKRLRTVEVRPG